MKFPAPLAFATLASVILASHASAADAPVLAQPIDCRLGETCFVQSYVDVDPTPAARDYRCGSATYDGHKGTDFRLLSTVAAERGVRVLAAAPGTVKGLRSTMPDRLINGAAEVAGRECGNGVVIDHGDGWETQYCHMRRGTIAVRKGQSVETGTPLGLVGYSGKTQFAHLHFSVSRNGQPIDPFSGHAIGQACNTHDGRALWSGEATPAYADAIFIDAGFISGPVDTRTAETGKLSAHRATAESPALVFYARILNARAGDRLHLTLKGPAGLAVENAVKPLERHKAQYIAFAGRRSRTTQWPAGRYLGEARLLRNGALKSRITRHLDFP